MKPISKPAGGKLLSGITKQAKTLPNRILLHALQKWGKSSFACFAPEPVFAMTRGEDGLRTLIKMGQVPPTMHFPEDFTSWRELKQAVQELGQIEHPYKTFVLDTVNGAERLCFEHVCETQYEGKWDVFNQWGQGTKVAIAELVQFTTLMDRLRDRGMGILLLCHSQVKPFRNPQGNDYDRWEPVLEKATWAHMDRWVDAILFGDFETFAEARKGQKAKATGGEHRIIKTERTAAYDAGNRLGLTDEIDGGESPQEAWTNFIKALKGK